MAEQELGLPGKRGLREGRAPARPADLCSGLLIPDTKLGGRIAISEVFNEQTTSILFGRVQT